jgi:SAM-dependent methyltransferase
MRKPRLRWMLGWSLTLSMTAVWVIGQAQQRTPDVQYVPTPHHVVAEMLRIAGVTKDDVVYDLGSGDGRVVIAAVTRYGARGVGVDIDPQRIEESRANARNAGVADRVTFLQQDLFATDIREATVVSLYLLPKLNLQLRPKLFSDLRLGTRVVSHAFAMGLPVCARCVLLGHPRRRGGRVALERAHTDRRAAVHAAVASAFPRG